jgi:hypothetical protein
MSELKVKDIKEKLIAERDILIEKLKGKELLQERYAGRLGK